LLAGLSAGLSGQASIIKNSLSVDGMAAERVAQVVLA
jgi:hypothetical protein